MLPAIPSIFDEDPPPAPVGLWTHESKAMADWMQVTLDIAEAQTELTKLVYVQQVTMIGALKFHEKELPWTDYATYKEDSIVLVNTVVNKIDDLVIKAAAIRGEWIAAQG